MCKSFPSVLRACEQCGTKAFEDMSRKTMIQWVEEDAVRYISFGLTVIVEKKCPQDVQLKKLFL